MKENESKSLTKIRSAVHEQISLTQLAIHLESIPIHEQLEACAIFQESTDPEVREGATNFSQNLKPEIVHESLSFLLDCQESPNKNVRDFAKSKYDLFGSYQLSGNLILLIGKLDSRYTLVRYYAEELLMRIEPVHLSLKLKLLYDFYSLDRGAVRRVTKKMLLKTMLSASPAIMSDNNLIVVEMQKSEDNEIKNLADWMYLTIARHYWTYDKICEIRPFLVECRKSESEAVKEVAAYLYLAVVSDWSIYSLANELDYFCSLQFSTEEVVRRKSRDFALTIMEHFDLDEADKIAKLYSKHIFLINCCESKFSSVTHRAKVLLKKIPAQFFFEDVLELIKWHAYAYKEARKKIRKILFAIPADMYIEILDQLLDIQKSGDPEQRYLTSELALRISREKLLTKKMYIQERTDSGYTELAILARELNFLIS